MATDLPRWLWPRSAYIHVPFCAHHCWYCDFAVVAGKDNLADRYLDALEKEIASLPAPQPVETLFVGGGTPTHLSERQLTRLLGTLRQWFFPPLPLGGEGSGVRRLPSPMPRGAPSRQPSRPEGRRSVRRPSCEFSVEANPGALAKAKIEVLAEFGVNRLSLGGQSFQGHLLRFLQRDHQPADIVRAVEHGHALGLDVSIDLIFGVPGQTLEQWQDDLRRALQLGVSHISTYGLTYEKGTPLWKGRQRGQVRPLDEDVERAMYESALDVLGDAGFEHYEISNFARPGRRSRHNQVYWSNHAYFGFGLGAARYLEGRREVNTRDVHAYLRKIEAGESPMRQSETLSAEERARETAALNLRRAEGIDRVEFQRQTGIGLDSLLGPVCGRLVENGLLEEKDRRVFLTREGKILADYVMVRLWRPHAD